MWPRRTIRSIWKPEPLAEASARVKYRGIAVADTARERPVLTVQLLDKQQRLTVSTH
jgi:hypothetical protein